MQIVDEGEGENGEEYEKKRKEGNKGEDDERKEDKANK